MALPAFLYGHRLRCVFRYVRTEKNKAVTASGTERRNKQHKKHLTDSSEAPMAEIRTKTLCHNRVKATAGRKFITETTQTKEEGDTCLAAPITRVDLFSLHLHLHIRLAWSR